MCVRKVGKVMENIIVYGVGAAFRNYLNENSDKRKNILFAVDSYFDKDNIYGIKVYRKEYLKEFLSDEKNTDFKIIIFAMSSKVVNEISEELTNMGLRYKDDFDEYSVLIKDEIKNKLSKYDVCLEEKDYLFTKSILKNLRIDNQSAVIGSWIMMSIIKKTKNIEGSIIELGAYKCGLSYFITLYKTINEDYRKYYIVDSFEGFKDYISQHDPMFLKSMFKDVIFEEVVDLFKDFKDVNIKKGFIPNVFKDIDENRFSFIYYDCDTYESCKVSLNYFYPKLCSGGFFLIHDYSAKEEGATGVKKAVDEFLVDNSNIAVIHLPETTHIIMMNI